MRCAVKNCCNHNKTKQNKCEISFFKFPTAAALQKKWKDFCDRDATMNVKTASICMQHFKPEDFENEFEYKMGFTRRRFLKKGVIPSIKKPPKTEQIPSERSKRAQKHENRRIVEMLLKQYDAAPDSDDKIVCEPEKIPVFVEESMESFDEASNINFQMVNDNDDHFVDLSKIQFKKIENSAGNNFNPLSASGDLSEVESLKIELKRLQEENEKLVKVNKKQTADLNAAAEKAKKVAGIYDRNIVALKTSLTKCEFQLRNLEEHLFNTLTKGEIAALKAGVERLAWSEEDTD